MIDIEKFICSLLADHPEGVTVRGDIHRALKEQELEYKDGKIVPIEDKTKLKESEDEKIRREMIIYLSTVEDKELIPYESWIAWIKKQGESVEINPDEIIEECHQDNADHIIDIVTEQQKTVEWNEEDELHIRELESLVKQEWAKAERENDRDKIHKMSDLSFFLKTLKPQLKQEWSKEDEKQARQIERIVHDDGCTQKLQKQIADWLKSIKDRIQSKPRKKNIEKNLAKKYGITGIGSKHAEGKLGEMIKKKIETEKV